MFPFFAVVAYPFPFPFSFSYSLIVFDDVEFLLKVVEKKLFALFFVNLAFFLGIQIENSGCCVLRCLRTGIEMSKILKNRA